MGGREIVEFETARGLAEARTPDVTGTVVKVAVSDRRGRACEGVEVEAREVLEAMLAVDKRGGRIGRDWRGTGEFEDVRGVTGSDTLERAVDTDFSMSLFGGDLRVESFLSPARSSFVEMSSSVARVESLNIVAQ